MDKTNGGFTLIKWGLSKILLTVIPSLLLACHAVSSNPDQTLQVQNQTNSMPASRSFFINDKVQIAYRDTGGDNPPVLLLHPMTGSDEIWQKQYTHLANNGFRVIGLSLRGAGLSGELPTLEHKDSQDILALLAHLNLHRVHVVGAAAGGIVALRFNINHPEKVSSLVISNSFAGLLAEELIELSKTFLPPPSLPSALKELGPTYRYLALQDKNGTELSTWNTIYQSSRSYKLSKLAPQKRKILYTKLLQTLATEDELKRLDTPTLLIYGGADLLMPPSIGAHIQKRLVKAEIKVIPLAGHAAHWEFPDKFNIILLDFLSQVDDKL